MLLSGKKILKNYFNIEINDEIVLEDHLKIPHPFIHKRRFVLEPLNEISPQLIHPLFQKNIGELLKECDDTGIVTKIKLEI